jgi:hypothetical protein
MARTQSINQLIKAEYVKCANDPVYFFKTYCYIQHPTRGKILFDTYDFQDDVLVDFSKHLFNIILKSRQLGISTLTAGYALWLMLFKEDQNILVIATTQDVAKNLITKVKYMHDNLPSWLRLDTEEQNKLSLRFVNGSTIKAVSSTGTAGRSEALSLLIIDEAAFIQKVDEIWTSAQSTLSTGGSAIILSTPNGVGNFFHNTWMKSESGNDWNGIRLHWTDHPERTQIWRDKQTALLGEAMAAQECDCDFITSGYSVVAGTILEWYKENWITDPIEKRGFDGNYWLWKYPDYERDYIVVADVARGDGGDYSTFHVIDVESVEQVAEYRGKIETKPFGDMLVSTAIEWNNALLVIENANVGWAVIQQSIDRHYNNLYYSYKDFGYVDEGVHLQSAYDMKDKSKMVPGFSMTTRTRPLVISKLDTYMREKVPIIHSIRLINELYVFVWQGSKAIARDGHNDDLVMAFSTALWVRDTALRLRQKGIDLNRSAIQHTTKSNSFYSSNQNAAGEKYWNMQVGKEQENLNWLL